MIIPEKGEGIDVVRKKYEGILIYILIIYNTFVRVVLYYYIMDYRPGDYYPNNWHLQTTTVRNIRNSSFNETIPSTSITIRE